MKSFEDLRREKMLQESQHSKNIEESSPSHHPPSPQSNKEVVDENPTMTEAEKRQFEEELDMQLLGMNTTQSTFNPYQHGYKKLHKTLLLSVVILGIIVFSGWSYTKNHYSTLSEGNVEMMQRAISSSVREYYVDYGRVPTDHQGNIDYNLLKKTGYLELDVEEYRDKFILDSSYRVIKKD